MHAPVPAKPPEPRSAGTGSHMFDTV